MDFLESFKTEEPKLKPGRLVCRDASMVFLGIATHGRAADRRDSKGADGLTRRLIFG